MMVIKRISASKRIIASKRISAIKRITTIIILLMCVQSLLAQSEPSAQEGIFQLRTTMYGLPEQPAAGSKWTLVLLVSYPNPNDVDVLAPPFTGSLMLEQVVKAPRSVNASELWTAMEYRFTLGGPGTIRFGAFTVITPLGQIKTDPFNVVVQRSPSAAQPVETPVYRLVWEGIPSSLKTGESAILGLRVSGWASVPPAIKTALASGTAAESPFAPPVPPEHIVESLSLSSQEKSEGLALKLRLIPLETSPFVLERRRLSLNSAGAAIFEIPALRIPVIAVSTAAVLPDSTEGGGVSFGDTLSSPPFPIIDAAAADQPALFRRYRDECQAIYDTAKNLWEKNHFAAALAELRQKERDHPAGKLIAVIRREAEQSLGFTGTSDEKKRLFGGKNRSAVLRETTLRRIPDPAGEEAARLREGQPVQVLPAGAKQQKWLQIITNDTNEISGWAPEENIIFY